MVLLKTMISRNRKARRMAKEAGNAASLQNGLKALSQRQETTAVVGRKRQRERPDEIQFCRKEVSAILAEPPRHEKMSAWDGWERLCRRAEREGRRYSRSFR